MSDSEQPPINEAEWSKFMGYFREETDRGAALTGAAFLDKAVKDLLQPALVSRNKSDNLKKRIDSAYELTLIDEAEHADIHMVRRIRNIFAHQYEPMSFGHPDVRKELGDFRTRMQLGCQPPLAKDDERTRFIVGVTLLTLTLMSKIKANSRNTQTGT